MTKFIIEQLRKENAFLNDMLENAHNRSRLLKEQLQQAQTELSRYKQGVEAIAYEADGCNSACLALRNLPKGVKNGQRVKVLVRAKEEVCK